jgi:hypothetical protein
MPGAGSVTSAGVSVSKCAETVRMARGRGPSAEKLLRKRCAAVSFSAVSGEPCETKAVRYGLA